MDEVDPQQQLELAGRLYEMLQPGQELGPWETVFTEEDVRAYAAAIGDDDPWYLRRSASGGLRCHPAMTAPISIWLFQEERHRMLGEPAQPLVGVHAAACHHYLGPVPVGKRLIARSKVTDKYIRRQRYYAVVETRTVDEEGRDVVHSRDTFLLTPVRIPCEAG